MDQTALSSFRDEKDKTLGETCPRIKELALRSPNYKMKNDYFKKLNETNGNFLRNLDKDQSDQSLWGQLKTLTLNCPLDPGTLFVTLTRFTGLENLDLSLINLSNNLKDKLTIEPSDIIKKFPKFNGSYAHWILYTIATKIPNLKKLRLPLHDNYLTKQASHFIVSNFAKRLRALSTVVSDESIGVTSNPEMNEMGFDMSNNIFKQLNELQILRSEDNKKELSYTDVTPERHKWMMDNISENLVVFECFWFFICDSVSFMFCKF